MKKNGFTLAEVLLTLGILGVITALTIPALMSNVENEQMATGLRTNKSMVERAFSQMLATNGADSLDATPLWQDLSDSEKIMKETFNVNKKSTGVLSDKIFQYNSDTVFNGIDNYESYALPNGSYLYFDFHDAQPGEVFADVYIDVNGVKRPNMLGRDVFAFGVNNRGLLLPYGSEELNEMDPSKYPTWNSESGCQGKGKEVKNGALCTARLVDKGFKVDY